MQNGMPEQEYWPHLRHHHQEEVLFRCSEDSLSRDCAQHRNELGVVVSQNQEVLVDPVQDPVSSNGDTQQSVTPLHQGNELGFNNHVFKDRNELGVVVSENQEEVVGPVQDHVTGDLIQQPITPLHQQSELGVNDAEMIGPVQDNVSRNGDAQQPISHPHQTNVLDPVTSNGYDHQPINGAEQNELGVVVSEDQEVVIDPVQDPVGSNGDTQQSVTPLHIQSELGTPEKQVLPDLPPPPMYRTLVLFLLRIGP